MSKEPINMLATSPEQILGEVGEHLVTGHRTAMRASMNMQRNADAMVDTNPEMVGARAVAVTIVALIPRDGIPLADTIGYVFTNSGTPGLSNEDTEEAAHLALAFAAADLKESTFGEN